MAYRSSTHWDRTSTPTSGQLVADHQRRAQPLVGEGGRHPDVDDHRVRVVRGHRAQELLGVWLGRGDLVRRPR